MQSDVKIPAHRSLLALRQGLGSSMKSCVTQTYKEGKLVASPSEMHVWTIHYYEGLFCILLYSKGSGASTLALRRWWLPILFPCDFQGSWRSQRLTLERLLLGHQERWSSVRLGAGGKGWRELSLEPLRFS